MRTIKVSMVGIIGGLLILGIVYIHNLFHLTSLKPKYVSGSVDSSHVTIGIIGDSWVAGNKLDTVNKNAMMSKGIVCRIFSSGEIGAKTKTIYENLLTDKSTDIFSSENILAMHPSYVIVISGVNDAAAQIGKNFYATHLLLIIRTLLLNKIKPVIVTLPEFGIDNYNYNLNFFKLY